MSGHLESCAPLWKCASPRHTDAMKICQKNQTNGPRSFYKQQGCHLQSSRISSAWMTSIATASWDGSMFCVP